MSACVHTLGESFDLVCGKLCPFLLPLIHLLHADNTLWQKESTPNANDQLKLQQI